MNQEEIREKLKSVIDPELGVNIVDLGLVYDIQQEDGILYQLQKQNPNKRFLPANPDAVCPFMKKITLPKVLSALRENRHVITVADDILNRAKVAIDRMIAIG